MALFNTDLEAIFFVTIIIIILVIINHLFRFIMKSFKKIPAKYKIIPTFILQMISVFIVIYLIIEGFPSFKLMPPEQQAILTGAISTAVAFASSGIFINLISGIILIIVKPFEIGDLVKIKGDKGIVRSINLTRVVIETFDYIFIEKYNSEVISSPIINYTINLRNVRNFKEFKRRIQSPLDKGVFQTKNEYLDDETEFEMELKNIYEKFFLQKKQPKVYAYTYKMTFPYRRFRIIMDKVENLCNEYGKKGIFRLKPRFHILGFDIKVNVKFRILAFNSDKIFDYQSQFTHDVYKIIYSESSN